MVNFSLTLMISIFAPYCEAGISFVLGNFKIKVFADARNVTFLLGLSERLNFVFISEDYVC